MPRQGTCVGGCAPVPVLLPVIESAERRFPALRISLLAVCCVLRLAMPLNGQLEPIKPGDQSIPNPVMLFLPGPNKPIEDAASAMTLGNSDSIRAVVEAMFKLPRYRMPEVMAAVVKQRLLDAETAYLDGKSAGVTDGAVVDALNSLATAFETPDYGRVSLLQVQYVRGRLTSGVAPTLFKPNQPDLFVGAANVPMSPLQAFFLMAVLIEQKLRNGAYQVPPADWDRDVYPRAVEQERARAELQRRIAAGEVQVQTGYELRAGLSISQADGTLLMLLQQRIAAMSVPEGLKLFNETFARLGIR